jgi:hypothetical protein
VRTQRALLLVAMASPLVEIVYHAALIGLLGVGLGVASEMRAS